MIATPTSIAIFLVLVQLRNRTVQVYIVKSRIMRVELCDHDDMTMTYACAAKKATGASCTSGDACESNFCNGNVCSVKKPTNALCMNSDECASDLCDHFPIRNGCSPGKCWECYDESTCNAQTGCNYDMMMSYCQQTSSGNCKTRPACTVDSDCLPTNYISYD